MSIQRYGPVWTGDESCSIVGNATGEYVLYKDHVDMYNRVAMDVYLFICMNADNKLAAEVSQIILRAGR